MAVPVALKLLEQAQKKEKKLSPRERRLVVAYLIATQPDLSNTEMAETFGVTEGSIRADRKNIREEKARFIKEDDVGLIIADIALDFERQVMDIERSKKQAKSGSKVFLDHCTAIMDMRLKMVKSLQDIGYVPKNLGNMTINKFSYEAIVEERTGNVQTERVIEYEEPPVIEGEVIDRKLLVETSRLAPTPQEELLDESSTTGTELRSVEDICKREEDSTSTAETSEAPSGTVQAN